MIQKATKTLRISKTAYFFIQVFGLAWL